MAIKFKGDTSVAIINSIKKAEVDTVYRCFDSGVLLSNEVINHGDFVSWDGTKWIKRSDLSYLISNAAVPLDLSIAPEYTKTPYPANSFVMHDGILYTNENAIGTAEAWTPAHWTQTTVSEMMASASQYKSVDLTLGVDDDKTIYVGQKTDIRVTCQAKTTDDLVIDLAENCTDAIIKITRTNYAKFRNFSIMRGSNRIQPVGTSIVTDFNASSVSSPGRFLVTASESEHGSYSPPTDFDEIDLNDEAILSEVSAVKPYEHITRGTAGSWIFVVKGRDVIYIPAN